jgi:sec-independent protein translocase protein TatA
VLLAGIGPLGPIELGVILLIVVLIFGAGRLPEVGGAVGKSIREFRKATKEPDDEPKTTTMASSAPPAATQANGATNVTSGENVFCGECGTSNPRTAKFCSNCGHEIVARVS